eukprot:scaffold33359_cov55-Attheya_sp.AAC.1
MSADWNEVVEYRIHFRASNKPNTDKLGVPVYDSIREEQVAPDFFISFMEDLKKTGSVSKEHKKLTPTMLTLRRLYNNNIEKCRNEVKLTTREFMKMSTGKDPYLCPCCGEGEMVSVSILAAI